MKRDNAPVGNTCPMIDNAISIIDEVYRISDDLPTKDYTEFNRLMEKIRSHNSELRIWGNEKCDQAEDLENELDSANHTIKRLQEEVRGLNKELSEIETLKTYD